MAADLLARQVTFNYDKGAATMTRGLADKLFGLEWRIFAGQAQSKTVTVKGHSRTRVIGEASKSVSGYSYTYKRYPTMDAQQAAGGQAAIIHLSDGTDWTVRVSGPMWSFCEWFQSKVVASNITVSSAKGTKYGPFGFNPTILSDEVA